MIYERVGETLVPKLGLGTWELTGSHCRDIVADALAMGYRLLDTAQGYDNESEIGRALRASQTPRESVFVVTKAWGDHIVELGAAAVLEQSLRRLRTDYVDLFLVHWPSPTYTVARTVEPLQDVLTRGLARHVGVSNFPTAQLDAACRVVPVWCNQVEFHPFLDQKKLLAACRNVGALLMAYSPLARGAALEDPLIKRVGESHCRAPAQVALRWCLQHHAVLAIPKAAQRRHLEANLQIFDFSLNAAQMRAISAQARGERHIDPDFAPIWDPPAGATDAEPNA